MKNLTHYSLLLNLVLLLFTGFILLRNTASQPSVSDADIHSSYAPSTQSDSFSELKSNEVTPLSSSGAVTPVSPPANNNTVWQLSLLGAEVLTIPGAEGEAVVPAVFAMRNTDTHLNSDQLDKINEIVRNFTHEVSAGNTNPDDPAYLARWQKAQADADDRLQLVLGQEDYFKYALAAGTMDTSK
jgi:hypothetical protein